MPGIYRWYPFQSASLLARAVLLGPFFWAIGLAAAFRSLRTARLANDLFGAHAFLAVLPVAMGVAQLALHGSNTNNIMEGVAMVALLAMVEWNRWWRLGTGWRIGAGAILIAPMLPIPLLHLVQAVRGVPDTEIRHVSLGNAIKLNRAQLAQRREFASWRRTLPKAIWIDDAMLGMPWFATRGNIPPV